MKGTQRKAWGVLFRSENHLDGSAEHLIGDAEHPCRMQLFETKKLASNYIKSRWGYIRNRPDLQQEPHGWKMPKPVKLTITYEYAE